MTYMQKYRAWLNDPAVSGGLRAELIAIESDEKEIEDRFYTELQFGTAGLRGVLGAGTNRMNELIVGRPPRALPTICCGRAAPPKRASPWPTTPGV